TCAASQKVGQDLSQAAPSAEHESNAYHGARRTHREYSKECERGLNKTLDFTTETRDKKLVCHPLAISFSKSQSLVVSAARLPRSNHFMRAMSEQSRAAIVSIDDDAEVEAARLVQRVGGLRD